MRGMIVSVTMTSGDVEPTRGKCLETVARFAHDGHVWLGVEQGAHALAHDGVVVDQQNADDGSRAVHASPPTADASGASSLPRRRYCLRLDSRE